MNDKETQISVEKNQITNVIEELISILNRETIYGTLCVSAIEFNTTGKVIRVEFVYF